MNDEYMRAFEDGAMFCDEHDEWYMDLCRECEHDAAEARAAEARAARAAEARANPFLGAELNEAAGRDTLDEAGFAEAARRRGL